MEPGHRKGRTQHSYMAGHPACTLAFFHMQRTGTEGMRYALADPGVLLPVPMLEQIWSQGLTDYRAFFQPFGSAVDPRLWPDLPSGRAVREGN